MLVCTAVSNTDGRYFSLRPVHKLARFPCLSLQKINLWETVQTISAWSVWVSEVFAPTLSLPLYCTVESEIGRFINRKFFYARFKLFINIFGIYRSGLFRNEFSIYKCPNHDRIPHCNFRFQKFNESNSLNLFQRASCYLWQKHVLFRAKREKGESERREEREARVRRERREARYNFRNNLQLIFFKYHLGLFHNFTIFRIEIEHFWPAPVRKITQDE